MFSTFLIFCIAVQVGASQLILTPDDGKLSGRGIMRTDGQFGRAVVWQRAEAYIFWDIEFSQTGDLQVSLTAGSSDEEDTFHIRLKERNQKSVLSATVNQTENGKQISIGSLNVSTAGKHHFKVQQTNAAAYLYSVSLSGPASIGARVVDVYRLQPYSTHLNYKDDNGGPIYDSLMFYNNVVVTSSTYSTFIMACGFNGGYKGGYFGIQQKTDKETGVPSKNSIFSVWGAVDAEKETPKPDDYAQAVEIGTNVTLDNFGGEGTGLKTLMAFDWQIRQTVEFLLTAEKGQHPYVHYSAYIFFPQDNQWKFIATLKRKNANQYLNFFYSFLEDWEGGMGHIPREASFSPWIKLNDGTWFQPTIAKFKSSNASATDTANLNGWNRNGRFFMRTGGDTTNTVKNDNSMVIRIPDGARPDSLKDIENVLKNKAYIK